MKRRIIRLAILALLIVLVFSMSGKVAASPEFPVFHSTETFCSAGDAEQSWFAGNTHHGRNALYTSYVDNDYPNLEYDSNDYVNWDINLKTMKGVAWGTFEQTAIQDSSYGWRGIWNSEMYISDVVMESGYPLWLNEGRGVGHGTGAFFGLQIKLEYEQSVEEFDEEPTGYPCWTGLTMDGDYFVLQQQATGYIIGLPDD